MMLEINKVPLSVVVGGVCGADNLSLNLPPREAWRVDPRKIRGLQAPTDDRGFVLPSETIETLLGFFDPEYVWPVDWSRCADKHMRPDDHHFYWPRNWYAKDKHRGSGIPIAFRQLPPHRGVLPRQFHNAWHMLFIPNDMPRLGHMERRLNSFLVAKQLFDAAELALALEAMVERPSEEFNLRQYYIRYDEVVNTFKKARRKAVGMLALTEIGIEGSDIGARTPKEVQVLLGGVTFGKVPNYVETYFETKAA